MAIEPPSHGEDEELESVRHDPRLRSTKHCQSPARPGDSAASAAFSHPTGLQTGFSIVNDPSSEELAPSNHAGEVLDGRLAEKRRGADGVAEGLFDPVQEENGLERISAELEEVVADAEGVSF